MTNAKSVEQLIADGYVKVGSKSYCEYWQKGDDIVNISTKNITPPTLNILEQRDKINEDISKRAEEIYEKARERILDGCNLPYTITVSHYNQDLALLNPTLASRYGIVGSFTKVGTDIVYSVNKFIKVGYGYSADSARYIYEEGNYACDCNRSEFLRNLGVPIDELDCGDTIEMKNFFVAYFD